MGMVDKFEADMLGIYISAKKECGYNATRYLQLLSEKGGLATAKQLINKPGGTDGFTTLWEHGRLDLSVEALALRNEYESLFTPEELRLCRERLEQYGYRMK